ncbi:DUF3224 domain-containing protein [Arthrobacter sp. UM1]|nr:DUF3224 domain-containing protein [Arthrobacter sp. UM1]
MPNYESTYLATFQVGGWDADPYTVSGSNSDLSQVQSTKDFEGDIEGVSYGRMLMAGNSIGAGYVASEVFVGAVGDRTGSFVFQHWGLAEGAAAASSGNIVPGSGTGELADISGHLTVWQDADGVHRIRLEIPQR